MRARRLGERERRARRGAVLDERPEIEPEALGLARRVHEIDDVAADPIVEVDAVREMPRREDPVHLDHRAWRRRRLPSMRSRMAPPPRGSGIPRGS
jgi:hypothetical protein